MKTISKQAIPELRYHVNAYKFLFQALRYTQEQLNRTVSSNPDDEDAHITGQELLAGIRGYALEQFGLLAIPVLRQWGITCTDDFGRMVFELIERGEMRKTERDQLSDFFDVYDFEQALDRSYHIDTRKAFRS